jgi:excisionase family DNA binding protein
MHNKIYSRENSRLVGDCRLVYEVPEAGEMLGLGRNASYQAARRGDIPTIKIGKLIRVPKAAFDVMLKTANAKTASLIPEEAS